MKESCFTADFDMMSKNIAMQKVREADNIRLSKQEIERRLADEREYNKKCRIELQTHI